MRFQTGDTVGDYEVLELLGKGGVGRVYKVRHKVTGRVEALKVLLPDSADDDDQAQRFLREIQVQAGLSHPHIAAVYNAFWHGGQLVMVVEYVDGESLDAVLERGRPPLTEGLRYASEGLAGLHHAHVHGVVHRDIKPANLLVNAHGTVKVTDFGLAKTDRDLRLTDTGAPMGSFYYAAPEQIQGNADARSDVYSMGGTLFELATGQRPFHGSNLLELMQAHLEKPPPQPSQLAPDVPHRLEGIILRALAKDPQYRFADAAEFQQELDAVRAELTTPHLTATVATPVASPPPAATQQPVGRAPRKALWGWFGIAAAALTLIIAGLAFAIIRGIDPEPIDTTLSLSPPEAPPVARLDLDPAEPALVPGEPLASPPTTVPEPMVDTSPPGAPPSPNGDEDKPSPVRRTPPPLPDPAPVEPAGSIEAPVFRPRPAPQRALPENITVALSTPVDSDRSPGAISAKIVVPSSWSGATLLGQVLEADSSGERRGKSRLRFEFFALVDGGQARPIEARIDGFRNSLGKPEVDDAAYKLNHDNGWFRRDARAARTAGATFSGRIGNDGRIRVRAITISGRAPRIRLDPGSEIDLRVR